MQIALDLAYDGSEFYGSQKQPQKTTVQGELEKALRLLNIDSRTIFSGRTDSKVHAMSQIVSLELPSFWRDIVALESRLNMLLPKSIIVKKIAQKENLFNARFCAKKRAYRYILSSKTTPFNHRYTSFGQVKDLAKFNTILEMFVGTHDFEYFSKDSSNDKNTVREVFKAYSYKHKGYVIIKFIGSSFLRSQVRMMVNFALKVYNQRLSSKQLIEQLDKKHIHSTHLASPNGLYLSKIYYR
jgi:tRNA pseudouridine38-40 synthase